MLINGKAQKTFDVDDEELSAMFTKLQHIDWNTNINTLRKILRRFYNKGYQQCRDDEEALRKYNANQ